MSFSGVYGVGAASVDAFAASHTFVGVDDHFARYRVSAVNVRNGMLAADGDALLAKRTFVVVDGVRQAVFLATVEGNHGAEHHEKENAYNPVFFHFECFLPLGTMA